MLDILVAIICSQFVGVLWYSPLLAGKEWSCAAFPGCSVDEIQTLLSQKTKYGIAFLSSIFLSLLLKFYVLQSVTTVAEVLPVASVLGGVSAVLEVSHYGFECRPWKLFVIDHIHNFLNIFVIGSSLVLV